MARWIYPGTFCDAAGCEPIAIENDGRTLRVTLRGVMHTGDDFTNFTPIDDPSGCAWISDCELRCEIPLPLTTPDGECVATLGVQVTLGPPDASGVPDREDVVLTLRHGGHTLVSPGTSGGFEDELLALQRQLPEGTFMRACINCGLSDYSPYGRGMFGDLMCFRDNKAGYRAVHSKGALFAVWNTGTEFVQETYLCPEFERRVPGTGYRG